ncbi:NPL4 [Hepatospora eriocheir]|uniref:Nuclear protein localization protein 4 n=1 Tax=Hepatospora eriocheir TaxID=1081669 RepID=A0A1X0Q9Y7_9MICR|nr:NPL4 [Hepatospora eriocheir]
MNVESMEDLKDKIREELNFDKFDLYADADKETVLDKCTENCRVFVFQREEDTKVKKKRKDEEKKDDKLDSLNIEKDDKNNNKYLSYKLYKELLKESNREEPEYNYIVKRCSEHSRNEMCTRCMERTITLVPQVYRHVDYVEFDNKEVVEEFIESWKNSKRQRIGLLVGKKIEKDKKIRGIVSAIWKIEQENYPDGVHIPKSIEYPFKDLEILGLIYTDLHYKENNLFSYKIEQDCLISSFELIFFYKMSKLIKKDDLINVCVTLDEESNIILKNYMISKQLVALLDADILKLCSDQTVFLNNDREILYMYKNEYNYDESIKASPFVPLEYFIVTSEVGFYQKSLFKSNLSLSVNTLRKLADYFNGEYVSFDKYSNFNVLLAISKYNKDLGNKLLKSVIKNNIEDFTKLTETTKFNEFIIQVDDERDMGWICNACTFKNTSGNLKCNVCGGSK